MSQFDSSDLMSMMSSTPTLDALSQERMMANQQALAMDMQNRQRQMDMDAMEEVAKQKMQLLLEEQELNLKMAQAESAGDEDTAALLEETLRKRLDLSRRENAASAARTTGNEAAKKELDSHLGNLDLQHQALGAWAEKYKGGLGGSISGTVAQWMKDPTRGGRKARSAGAEAFMGIGRAGERLTEIFTGDKFADQDLRLYLGTPSLDVPHPMGTTGADTQFVEYGGGTGGMSAESQAMAAAAARVPGFVQKMNAVGSSGMFLDFFNDIAQEPFNKQANQYAARLLSSVVSDSLVSSGVNISSNTARQTLDNVMMQLMDLTRSTVPASGAAAEEASARILPLLKNAAGEIFGPQEGANALPKLVHAITDAMNEASPMAATYMSKLGPVIDTEAVQNASLAYSFSQAARLKNALAAVTTGKVATQEQIGLALGKLQTLKNTGDWGAIDLEDKNIRAALSELSAGAGVGRLSDVLKEGIAREKAYRTTKEKLGQEAVGMETEAEIKARRATLAGKIRAGKLKAEMISNKMNELRNAPR